MKKTLYLIAIFTFLISCSEDEMNSIDIDGVGELTERNLTKIESQYYDTSSGVSANLGVTLLENGKIKEALSYENNILTKKYIYEYNSDGLVDQVLHFDGNNSSLADEDYTILYDPQNRISNIMYSNHTVEFVYNTDNTITRIASDATNSNLSTGIYSLNQNGKINKYVSGNNWIFDFEYVNDQVMSGTMNVGSTLVDVEYDYETISESKGYSYHKLFKDMFGSANNAIFTSNRSIENMIALFYGESNPTLVKYSSTQQGSILESTFHYLRDEENYVTEYDLIANGNLYCQVKLTYED